jgi:hypothetical protein
MLIAVFLAAQFGTPSAAVGDLTAKRNDVGEVTAWIREIKAERDQDAREGWARRLVNAIQRTNVAIIDDATIDDISSLLDDESDQVRGRIAMVLAAIGPRAARAAPALNVAFVRATDHILAVQRQNFTNSGFDVFTGHTSADEICFAFQQTMTPAPRDCFNGYYAPR